MNRNRIVVIAIAFVLAIGIVSVVMGFDHHYARSVYPWSSIGKCADHSGSGVTTAIKASEGRLRGVVFNAHLGDAIVSVYDNASAASGTEMTQLRIKTAGNSVATGSLDIHASNGITAKAVGGEAFISYY